MREIKLYKSKTKALKLLALTIPFVVGGILLILRGETLIGWLCTLFFGLCFMAAIFHLFDKRPQIVINENGIWDRVTKQEIIKWEQIIDAYPINISGQKFISLVVDDNFVFKQKRDRLVEKLNKMVGAQYLNLSLGQLDINENMLTIFIEEMAYADRSNRQNIIDLFFSKLTDSDKATTDIWQNGQPIKGY